VRARPNIHALQSARRFVIGFVLLATDYVERWLCPETICSVGMDTRILETSAGFEIIELVTGNTGQVLLILVFD